MWNIFKVNKDTLTTPLASLLLTLKMIMVKNCVTFQKLHFFAFLYSKCQICGWHIPFRLKISELKELSFQNYPLATPAVVWVLFLSDTLWVTGNSDHAVENVSHILSLSYFYNQTSFLPFRNIWIFPKIFR